MQVQSDHAFTRRSAKTRICARFFDKPLASTTIFVATEYRLCAASEELAQSAMSQPPETISNATGVVKWFDPKKGFGFVVGPQGQDIFVHFSKIDGEGFRVLKDGSEVVYDATLTDKGWHATRVQRPDEGGEQIRRPQARTPRR